MGFVVFSIAPESQTQRISFLLCKYLFSLHVLHVRMVWNVSTTLGIHLRDLSVLTANSAKRARANHYDVRTCTALFKGFGYQIDDDRAIIAEWQPMSSSSSSFST